MEEEGFIDGDVSQSKSKSSPSASKAKSKTASKKKQNNKGEGKAGAGSDTAAVKVGEVDASAIGLQEDGGAGDGELLNALGEPLSLRDLQIGCILLQNL